VPEYELGVEANWACMMAADQSDERRSPRPKHELMEGVGSGSIDGYHNCNEVTKSNHSYDE
jgi:hypothetical protein